MKGITPWLGIGKSCMCLHQGLLSRLMRHTWLLTWNAGPWPDLPKAIARTEAGQRYSAWWRFHAWKQGQIGDRVYLLKQGHFDRGIVASGVIVGGPKLRGADDTPQAQIKFDRIVKPEHGYPRDLLDNPPFNSVHWNSQASGISIPNSVVAQLEQCWLRWVQGIDRGRTAIAVEARAHGTADGEFIPSAEGRRKVRQHIAYERSARNRAWALQIHGAKCKVCDFDFNSIYGRRLARDYIEIHHTWPVARLKGGPLNPKTDLIPLCSNCHSMAHRDPERTIPVAKLRSMVQAQRRRAASGHP
jgi:hypothetical protein